MESSYSTNLDNDASYMSPSYKIYCEDDYFNEESSKYYHTRCDLMKQEAPSPLKFDYPRFTQYLQLKSEIESRNRVVEAGRGIVSPGLDYYTDEILKEELYGIYGGMDENSERFRIIFENYKIQRLEQIQEWIAAESRISESESTDDDSMEHKEREFIDEEEALLKYFSLEEIQQFSSLSEGGTEPFLLPRKRSSNHVTKHKDSSKRKQTHFKNQIDLIAQTVSKVLHENPLGLTINILLKLCTERLKENDYRGPPINVDILLQQSPFQELIATEKYNATYLAFPSDIRPYLLRNPMQILWNVKHMLLAILNLSYGIVEVNDCVRLLNEIFHVKQFDWGFQSEKDFLKDVFEKWKSGNAQVIELTMNKRTASYLAVVTKKSNKLIQEKSPITQSRHLTGEDCITVERKKSIKKKQSGKLLYSASVQKGPSVTAVPSSHSLVQNLTISKSRASPQPGSSTSGWNKTGRKQPETSKCLPLLNYNPSAKSIDPQFVQLGDKMLKMQDYVKPGSQMSCVVAFVNSPTSIYLVQLLKWKELNRFFCDMGDYWLANPKAEWPHPQFLQKNFICMAKTENEEEPEVYRVVLVGKPDPLHYQAYCVDYGDLLKVKHEQLRYLPKEYLHYMEAQAIPCSLYNVASPKKDLTTGLDIWSKDVCDFTRKLFLPEDKEVPIVKVHFKQRMDGNGKWLVKVGSPPGSLDFGEDIMKFVNGESK